MATIKPRGYTEADWLAAQGDPVLADREIGFVTDTGEHVLGDGATAFSALTRLGGQSGAYAAAPLFARKTSDQTVNNSATPVADTALTVSVEANKTYWFDLLLFYESSTSADIRLTFPLPSGATLRWAALPGLSNSTASVNGDMRAQGVTDNGTLGLGGAGVADTAAMLSGVLVVGANAGSFTLNWAQLTAEASDTKVKSGSGLKLQEVA